MSQAAEYRERAARFRNEAILSLQPETRALLLQIAREYDMLASEMDAGFTLIPPTAQHK